MPHPYIHEQVALQLKDPADFVLVGELLPPGFRGVYRLRECYAVSAEAFNRGDLKFNPKDFLLHDELFVERGAVVIMVREGSLHDRLKAANDDKQNDKNNNKNKNNEEKERENEPGDICEEDRQG